MCKTFAGAFVLLCDTFVTYIVLYYNHSKGNKPKQKNMAGGRPENSPEIKIFILKE
jgi:hypothetical protein